MSLDIVALKRELSHTTQQELLVRREQQEYWFFVLTPERERAALQRTRPQFTLPEVRIHPGTRTAVYNKTVAAWSGLTEEESNSIEEILLRHVDRVGVIPSIGTSYAAKKHFVWYGLPDPEWKKRPEPRPVFVAQEPTKVPVRRPRGRYTRTRAHSLQEGFVEIYANGRTGRRIIGFGRVQRPRETSDPAYVSIAQLSKNAALILAKERTPPAAMRVREAVRNELDSRGYRVRITESVQRP